MEYKNYIAEVFIQIIKWKNVQQCCLPIKKIPFFKWLPLNSKTDVNELQTALVTENSILQTIFSSHPKEADIA